MGKVLTKHIPQHENKAQPNHHPQDDCISPLSEVDFFHQVVDHWKFVCQVVQFGLNSLKRERIKGLRTRIQIKSSGVNTCFKNTETLHQNMFSLHVLNSNPTYSYLFDSILLLHPPLISLFGLPGSLWFPRQC